MRTIEELVAVRQKFGDLQALATEALVLRFQEFIDRQETDKLDASREENLLHSMQTNAELVSSLSHDELIGLCTFAIGRAAMSSYSATLHRITKFNGENNTTIDLTHKVLLKAVAITKADPDFSLHVKPETDRN